MRFHRARIEDVVVRTLLAGAAATVVGVLVLILGTVIWKGLPVLTWEMVSRPPQGGYYLGGGGGILNAIVGSLLLTAGATVLSLAISFPVVFYLNVYARTRSRMRELVRLALDILWGVPSIVYGAFGFTLMLFFGLQASLAAGIITVALLIFPIMSRAIDEVMRTVPRELQEASDSLGATRLETGFRVVVRQALPGIFSAVLIAFGRGIGDAASVLFTAGYSDRVPTSLTEPAATLPLAIFFQLGTPLPEVQQRAYASALVLTGIVLVISLSARWLARRYGTYSIH